MRLKVLIEGSDHLSNKKLLKKTMLLKIEDPNPLWRDLVRSISKELGVDNINFISFCRMADQSEWNLMDGEESMDLPLVGLGIKSADCLKVLIRDDGAVEGDRISRSSTVLNVEMDKDKIKNIAQMPKSRIIVKKMKDDNSCLFNCISYLLCGGDTMSVSELRMLVANAILQKTDVYDEGILGRKPELYAEWIQRPNSWGGGIELAVFSDFFSIEIASIDLISIRLDLFGSGKGHSKRIYIFYSGIHYDAIVEELSWVDLNGGQSAACEERRIFETPQTDSVVEPLVMDLARQAHLDHQYTCIESFTLKCSECDIPLIGVREAEDHAQLTGHQSFSEYSS